MAQRLANYLRTYRRRAGLTQNEVAFLLGTASGTRVSRYERFGRQPRLPTALAYEVVFAAPQRQLFGGLYERVESQVHGRVGILIRRLEAENIDPRTRLKLTVLRGIVSKIR
jgi:transcriptional regulator with XRE-family HTH domain